MWGRILIADRITRIMNRISRDKALDAEDAKAIIWAIADKLSYSPHASVQRFHLEYGMGHFFRGKFTSSVSSYFTKPASFYSNLEDMKLKTSEGNKAISCSKCGCFEDIDTAFILTLPIKRNGRILTSTYDFYCYCGKHKKQAMRQQVSINKVTEMQRDINKTQREIKGVQNESN